ncbi:putative ATPase/DNA-binding winged helix-turn-helix (wHTH) protein [Pararhizobium capsulatum DSM 1112]|uniref:ATPase/DNA-binding winged helix-turn-helix (WHTH) protein n=1 Tax=Pararhizobium capsulatum DSM 1112 TaxID=1121113 RepID=A0ABU0BPV4_9HYPH|nr:winged helix-turn-helix domain-containing protein [Pararhizobium capsulatum]MDQ0320268.1 putative ATPase/DNA-binding winged helix-turn-helix (wHTH) protein [Pararhizobium capsulatum DSM 1112]
MAIAEEPAFDELSFGPFNLHVAQRLLTKDSAPVELGARALDILIVLTASPNKTVSKQDLISLVWPDVIVEEGSLRFQMNSLRKALGDGLAGARYITTVAGRGYCFVAPLARSDRLKAKASTQTGFQHANLPSRLSRMVGRNDDVLKLSAQVVASRFVTIVGPGGIGKTTVAVAVGHHLNETFAGATLFVDLGMIGDANLVATTVASLLGLSVGAGDATSSIVAFLRDKRILLILDTCEHVLDAVATVAAGLVEAASEVHILATSREALRTDGERVYRLDSLGYPSENVAVTAAVIQEYPATRLFVERAVASDAHLDIADTDAPLIGNLCRKLEGVPLAIELAARHVEAYGLHQTSVLLNEHLSLRWPGSRTAPPRQRTLQATLDWSYELLSQLERTVLRRLAIFVGNFTLDAAGEIVASADLDRQSVFGAIDSLIAKSMVAVRPIGAMLRYRLLDTTRSYALEIPIGEAECFDLALRHVVYCGRWLEQIAPDWVDLASGTERASHFDAVGNVRAALEWCFGDTGDLNAGVILAATAAPAFLAMSLLSECHHWSERAIEALDDVTRAVLTRCIFKQSSGLRLPICREKVKRPCWR